MEQEMEEEEVVVQSGVVAEKIATVGDAVEQIKNAVN